MTSAATQTAKTDVYQLITDAIIARLEAGVIPWKCAWIATNPPANYLSRRPYTGINALLLASFGYEQPYFLTFHQVKELGGMVKKGAKSIPVIFYKLLTSKDNEDEKIPLLQYYRLFHISDTEGIDFQLASLVSEPVEIHSFEQNALCQQLISAMPLPPTLTHGGNQPCYNPLLDTITIPSLERFISTEEYYQTLYHELIHSTGHASRLNRNLPSQLDIQSYSEEELVAEIGASYLSSLAGIASKELLDNAAAYIGGWLQALKNDRKLMVGAASKAHKAVGYILADSCWVENSL